MERASVEMGMKRDVGGSSLGEEVALLGPSQSKGTGGLISAPAPNSASMKASPSYEVLNKAGLLTLTYLKNNISDLDLKKPNTTKGYNMRLKTAWACCLPPMLGCVVYSCLHKEYHVLPRHVLKLIDDKGDHRFAGPGLHNIGCSNGFSQVLWTTKGNQIPLTGHINHGDRNILIVDQGYVGLAWDRGDPVLFPPGIHEWKSDTLVFNTMIDLGNPAITVGPYTLLTVNEGYSAVTQNNGKQVILQGGYTHFLSHRNWRFNHFISLKIQTDNLEKIHATSADNIIMGVTSTVNWRIVDVEVAALMAAETMNPDTTCRSADITKLRKDVLKQAVASLATFIGSVNYSDSFHLAAAAQSAAFAAVGTPASSSEPSKETQQDNPLFNRVQMKTAVEHANEVTRLYGVQVLSINVISADPVDGNLTRALASGAVAAAEALQAETAARGNSKAMKIETQTKAENSKVLAEAEASAAKIKAGGAAEAELIKARADSEAERLRASGAKDAADLISSSQVAVDLAKMDKAGTVIGQNAKYFFGEEPKYMSNLLLKGAI